MSDLTPYQPATNNALAQSIVGIEASLEEAARANVQVAVDEHGGFTALEVTAMQKIEELRLINGLDLYAIMARGKRLREIEELGLIGIHPAGYADLAEMAQDQGISVSEMSQTRDLYNTIFPYINDTLGRDIPEIFERVGKSNFREMTPVLKSLILDEEAASASARASVERVLEQVQEDAGDIELEDDDLRQRAVGHLIDQGALLTNRELRAQLRPERTPNAGATVIQHDGQRMILIHCADHDQYEMVQRRINSTVDALVLDEDSVFTTPELRTLQEWLE